MDHGLIRFDAAPVSVEQLDRLEHRLGVPLPVALRRILSEVGNGGVVRTVPSPAFSPMVELQAFYGVDRDDIHDLERVVARMVPDRVPEGFVPFADSVGGNLVCFSTRPIDAGSVWFWDHELELGRRPMSELASSMNDFLGGLSAPAEPQAPPDVVSIKVRDPEWLARIQAEQRARRLQADAGSTGDE